MVEWGPVPGRVVFDSTVHPVSQQNGSTGFSIMGSRSLLLTDAPAVLVHDSGASWGEGAVHRLAPPRPDQVDVDLLPRTTRLRVRVAFPDGRVLRATTTHALPPDAVDHLAWFTRALLDGPDQPTFWSPAGLPVTFLHRAPTPPGDPAAPPGEASAVAHPPVAPLPAPPTDAAVVVARAGRLALVRSGEPLVSWPLDRVAIVPAGPTALEVRGGAELGPHLLTGVVLDAPHEKTWRGLLALGGDAGGEAAARLHEPATTAVVAVTGLPDAGPDGGTVECVLGPRSLDLQTRDGQRSLARFDLTHPGLRVAGTAERFVVADPATGPVAVASRSEQFGQMILASPALQAAAVTTLARGPYPVETLDGVPVLAAPQERALRVRGPGVDAQLAYAAIDTLASEVHGPRASLRVAVAGHGVALQARTEHVQALHTRLRAAATATAPPGKAPDLLRATLGLEEDYVLSTVFGPVYELHAAVLGSGDPGVLDRRASAPDTEADRERMTAALTSGLADLRQHVDHVAHVLAPFVRSRDAALVAPATGTEPDWLKASEARLRAALTPTQRVAAEAAQLLSLAARLPDGDLPVARADYTAAAITMGASVINPVFMVGGIAQLLGQRSTASRRKAELTSQTRRVWDALLAGWTVLVEDLVPTLSYTVTENVFGVRYEVGRQVSRTIAAASGEAQREALRRLADRVAVLDVSRRYPATPALGISRGAIADHVRSLRDRVRVPRFVEF